MRTLVWSLIIGLAGIGVIVLALLFIARSQPDKSLAGKVLSVIQGQDGRLSSSKFQWFVWTIAAVGGFSALFAARALRGASAGDIGVPANILIALGFSTATMATAKGITTAYIAGGRVDKSADKSSLKGGILTDDDGIADLSKIQLITWTIIAIAIWIYLVLTRLGDIAYAKNLDAASASLPDIPTALMVLMGLSQGGYLGKKLVTVDAFHLSLDALIPSTAKPKEVVALYGEGFGEAKADARALPANDNSAVLVGGRKADTAMWSDRQVQFQVPELSPDNNIWSGSEPVPVGVVMDGHMSDKTLTLTVIGPPSQTV